MVSATLAKEQTVIVKSVFIAAAVAIVLGSIMMARVIIAPMFMAVFFAIILYPPLKWLKSKGLPEILALIVLSTLVLVICLGVSWVIINSLMRFKDRIPAYRTHINQTIDQVQTLMTTHGLFQEEAEAEKQGDGVESAAFDHEDMTGTSGQSATLFQPKPNGRGLEISADTLMAYVRYFLAASTRLVTVSFIIMLLVIFMLIEATTFPKKFAAAFGTWNITNAHLKTMAEEIRRYMVLKGVVSIICGATCTVFLHFMGIEYALLWGVLMFFLNFIPNIGTIVAAIPPVLLALIDHGLGTCFVVVVGYVLINCCTGYIIEPHLLGKGLGISPLVVLLSLFFWGYLLGLIGLFLAAPLSVVMKIILQTFDETRWIAVLMANKVVSRE